LIAIAWPMTVAKLAQIGTGVVDTIMAGRYSAEDLAAVAVGYNIWLPLFLFCLGVMLATSVIVAQSFGAGQAAHIRASLPQALWLALLLGAVVGPACYHTGAVLDQLGLQASTRAKSLAYLRAVSWGLPASVVVQAVRCHAQGLGFMKPYAAASIAVFLANIPLNYALIYGNWGAPELGAAGCGLATSAAMWLGAACIVLFSLGSAGIRDYLPAARLAAPDWRAIREILRLGLPMGLSVLMEIGVPSVIGLMIATLGNQAMAAHQIAINLWDVIYMPLMSVGSAMTTRLGHAIGAGDRAAVSLSVRTGMASMLLLGLAATLLLLSIPDALIGMYTNDAGIHGFATTLLRLATLFIVIDSLQIGGTFCLRAFRDTRFPFLVTCLSYWLFALPLAWWWGLGNTGNPAESTRAIWLSLILGICVAMLLILYRTRATLRRPLPATTEQPAGGHSPGTADAA